MMWWPLFFITLLHADEKTVEKYCFNSISQMEKAYAQFKFISVPSDKVDKDEACFIVSANPHRRELIQKYLLSNHPEMSISFSSQNLNKHLCELKIEKHKTIQSNNQVAELAKKSQIQVEQKMGTGAETFRISTLNDFELRVDQDKISGKCRYITPSHYEITLTVQKDAIPLPPSGTVAATVPLPDQSTFLLTTTLHLQGKNKVEIGSIIQEIKNKNHGVNIAQKINLNSNERKLKEKIYLSIP